MKLETIKKKLEAVGISCTYNHVLRNEKPKKILVCDTNYFGAYPTTETWQKIETIRKVAKKNEVQTRGFYTAVFIYE